MENRLKNLLCRILEAIFRFTGLQHEVLISSLQVYVRVKWSIKKGNPRMRKPLCYFVLIPLDNFFERIETISGFGCFNKASERFTHRRRAFRSGIRYNN